MKPFVKYVNLSHLMPTRFMCDFELKKEIDAGVKDPDGFTTCRKEIRKTMKDKYLALSTTKLGKKNNGLPYFYQKLRF